MRPIFIVGILLVFTTQSALAAIVTTTADSGPGSLRSAIASAAEGETITFSVTGAVALTSGQISITTGIHIIGPGAEVLAVQRDPVAPAFRIFDIATGRPTISGITIRNGACDQNDDSGAGIQNRGNLSVLNCILESNIATDRGGAIYNAYMATLYVSNCVFESNGSTGDYGEGGGLYIFGNATILNSSFMNNAVHDRGGGLQVDMFGAALVNGCTFAGNSAIGNQGEGGGVYNFGTLAMTNCTLSGNIANDSGGALHNDGLALSLRIDSCTVVSNTAPEGGGLYLNGFNPPPQPHHLHNSIVSGNHGDIQSRITFLSDGFNLIGSSSGTVPLVLRTTDHINISPADLHLGELRNNGGPTPTHALLPGSLAFENGDDAHPPATDQRGVLRPHYTHCDVGAFELNHLSPSIVCTYTNLECSSITGLGTFSVTVSDPDADALTVIWGSLGSEFQTNNLAAGTTATPQVLTAQAPVGLGLNFTPVLLFDGTSESMNCLATVNVRDTTPPNIASVTATPNTLWPANHKMVPVTLAVSAADACGGVTSRIKSVTSSDPVEGRPGDWEITGALTLNLRAELASPSKAARVYTIEIESIDETQNISNDVVKVTVPRK